MKTIKQAIDYSKEIIAIDLENAFIKSAEKALGSHETVFPNSRTGHLLGNIQARPTDEGIEISMPSYSLFLEYGTGIYGPKKQVIKPKNAKVLHWKSNGKDYFATYVKGMTPAPFIRPVMHQQFTKIVIDALNEAFKEVKLTK